jgi:hypothetical protein
MACSLAQGNNTAAEIHVAYNEQWSSARLRGNLRFKSSNLKFAVAVRKDAAPPLQFRLEWAGREPGDAGALEFPGLGAAHPHWQFDADATWIADASDDGMAVDVQIPPRPEEMMELMPADQQADATSVPAKGRNPLFWFHRLHLPARAMWHEALRAIPGEPEGQQHEPIDTDEIDRWVISALRYLRHEFKLYA